MDATTARQVYDIVRRNGHLPLSQQPTDAQLWTYARLIIRANARFEIGRYATDSWTGMTRWQMSRAIECLQQELEARGCGCG
jgi:hypothetical protein